MPDVYDMALDARPSTHELFGFDTDEVTDVEWQDVHYSDYPDFSDAFISYANYKGKEMTEGELDRLMDLYPNWCYQSLLDAAF